MNDVLEIWVCKVCFSWPPDFLLDIHRHSCSYYESWRRVQKADKFLAWEDSPPTPQNNKLIHENLAKYFSNISRIISASSGKKKKSFQPQLGLDPPVTIVPTIAAPELQLSESPNILKRYDTPPAEHGSARWRRRWEGLTFELGWDFAAPIQSEG